MELEPITPAERLKSFLFKAGRGLMVLVLGGLAALMVFLALPFLQLLDAMGKKQLMVRSVDVAQPPPPPPLMEEPPPEEPPEPEEKPEMQESSEPLSLDQMALALNPGGGGAGDFAMKTLGAGASSAADKLFSMSDLDQKPRPTHQPSPQYPPALRKRGIQGTVQIEFVVDTRGVVSKPSVVKSVHPELDRAALDAVKQWKFQPAMRGGQPVPIKTRAPITFQAKNT
jgi:protein TonB